MAAEKIQSGHFDALLGVPYDDDLDQLFRVAFWAGQNQNGPPVSFTSLFVAFLFCEDRISTWFQQYASSAGVDIAGILRSLKLAEEDRDHVLENAFSSELPENFDITTISAKSILESAKKLAHNVPREEVVAVGTRHVMAAILVQPRGHTEQLIGWGLKVDDCRRQFADFAVANYPDEARYWTGPTSTIEFTFGSDDEHHVGEMHGVPPLPSSYVVTPLFHQLRNIVFKKPNRPVAICGTAGMGKTLLAATVAQDQEIRQAFPDGIFWFNNVIDRESLPPLPPAEDSSVQPNRLVIIDDIEKEYIPQVLNGLPGCILLITSRDVSGLTSVSDTVQLQGLSMQEATEILVKESGAASSKFRPDEIQNFVELSQGHPLIVAILAKLIQKDSNIYELWRGELNALLKTRFKGKKHEEVDVITVAIKTAEALMPEKTRQKFKALVGFEDETVQFPDLCRLWDLNEERTREVAQDLASISLIQFHPEEKAIHIHPLVKEYLRAEYPNFQEYDAQALRKSEQRLVELACDSEEGNDCLKIEGEVNTLCTVLAYDNLQPPMCVGLFGNWGCGKSFFMRMLQKRINVLCNASHHAEENKASTEFCSHVAQITFNAWYYVDANLWASLACRIFEGLDTYIEGHTQEKERVKRKAQLFKQLETSQQRLKEVERAKVEAEANRKVAEKNLSLLQQKLQTTNSKLKQLRSETIKKAISNETRAALEEAATELGLQGLADNLGQLEESIKALQSTSGRFRGLFLSLTSGKQGWPWGVLLVLVLGLIPILGPFAQKLLEYLKGSQLYVQIGAVVTEVGAVAALIMTVLNKCLRFSSKAIDRLEQARKAAEKEISERAGTTPKEAVLQKQLVVLKDQEEAARSSVKEAKSRVELAEREIAQFEQKADGKVLAGFIRERVSQGTYRSQLGIVSSIRKDLQSLSGLLNDLKKLRKASPEAANASSLPRIDRIILYIDDLDRCPEQTVVEVLQAVHLLLAFPLFVVVIGVDSRWLLQSLRHHFTALRVAPKPDAEVPLDTEWASTPQDYLEKIIQIPFNLAPMEDDGFGRLMEEILLCEEPEIAKEEPKQKQGPEPSQHNMGKSAEGTEVAGPGNDKGEATVEKVASDRSGGEIDSTGAAGGERPLQTEDAKEGNELKTKHVELDLTPEALKIKHEELVFLSGLSALIPTPRAGKRLANIYRLLRAGLAPVELSQLLGSEKRAPHYPPVMVLLAIQVGFPQLANEVFRYLCSPPDPSWEKVIKDLLTRSKEDPKLQRERVHLSMCIEKLQKRKSLDHTSISYEIWTNRVSRYSFRGLEKNHLH